MHNVGRVIYTIYLVPVVGAILAFALLAIIITEILRRRDLAKRPAPAPQKTLPARHAPPPTAHKSQKRRRRRDAS